MWDKKLIDLARLRPFTTEGDLSNLAAQSKALLTQQRFVWPRLAQGVEALTQVRTRTVELNAWPVTVQFNPGRSASSLAKVDAASIARRPCFLCAANSPPEQEGIRTGRFVLLTNPAPIVPGHLTVVHEQHVAQAIDPHLDTFLALSRQLGDDWTVFYNGPRCGASAPDHMHFQAALAGHTPIERDLGAGVCVSETTLPLGTRVLLMGDAKEDDRRTRCVFAVNGREADEVANAVRAIVGGLPRSNGDEEPLLNLLAQYRAGEWAVALFPRAAHRPRCYLAEGDARMLLSPGIMDMAGLMITVRAEDFERAGPDVLASVYREVGCTAQQCRTALTRLRLSEAVSEGS